MHKILIADKLSEAGINFLTEQAEIQVHIETGLNEAQLCDVIGDFDALLIRSDTKVTPKVLEAGKRLKLVGRAGIGVDNVDLKAATEQGVIVMNTPDANATTTAELAIAHLFSLSRHLPQADRSMREGKWERSKLTGTEVTHKTLAIFGFGTIGRIVSQRALGLKMRVIAHDPFVTADIFNEYGVTAVSFDDMLKQADYLTLHCPLNDKTRGIIGAAQLAKMKKSARIINCARGGIIDEAALYEALKERHIAGAALDVYEHEPPKGSPLLELDNVVFTPHLGASTGEAQVAVSVEIARQAVTYLTTGEAVNALNIPRVSAEELKKITPFLGLANMLGRVLVGLASEAIDHLEVALFGKAAEVDSRPIAVETLVGVLSGQVSFPVNRVNAVNLAERQGIALIELRSKETHDYLSLIRVTGRCGGRSLSLTGTLLGDRHPRLIAIDGYDVEVVPEGTLLVTRHEDRPGVIAALGGVLAKENINISRMQVGLANEQNEAMAVISVSEPLDSSLIDRVCDIPEVHSVTQIVL